MLFEHMLQYSLLLWAFEVRGVLNQIKDPPRFSRNRIKFVQFFWPNPIVKKLKGI